MIRKIYTTTLSVLAVLLFVLISCSKSDPEQPQPDPTPSSVAVQSVSLNKTSAEIKIGETIRLSATVSPSNASNKSVTWSSSNTNVATVSAGEVKGISAGTATITVRTNDSNKTASCSITVKEEEKQDIAVTSVTLSLNSTKIAEGDTLRLVATVLPDNATNKNIIWASNNTTVVTVSGGLITAIAEGNAQIIATSEDGGKADTCGVEVISRNTFIHVSSIAMKVPTSTLRIGEAASFSVTIEPENATNKNVQWKSSNPTIATVDAYGTVTALAIGDTEISATTEDGGLTTFAGITVIEENSSIPVTGITFDNTSVNMPVGVTMWINHYIHPENATNRNIKWSSSNPGVATVDNNGNVTSLALGNTIITATTEDGGFAATCNVSVIIPVDWIEVTNVPYQIATGDKYTLSVNIHPENATNKTLTWTSSNTAVATVDNGTITAIAPGEAEITVTSAGNTASTIFTVRVVKKVPVTGITVDSPTRFLRIGEQTWIGTNIQPENATNKNITWSSSNTAVASVDNGNVTAISNGEAEITATTEDGGFKASCKVIVGIPVDWIEITNTPYEIVAGDKYTLSVNIHPENATNKTLTWTSSNTAVATVDNGTITAIAPGEAEIRAESAGNTASTSFTVKVIEKVSVTGITVDNPTRFLRIGEQAWIGTNIQPENATNKNITWSSSNPAVASVDNGNVTAISNGETEITATTEDGGFKAVCKIIVGIPVDWIEITNTPYEIATGDKYTLSVNIHPENATNKTLTWTSSNTTVATVDNGTITAIAPGEAEITVTSAGNTTATGFTARVVKKVPVTGITIDTPNRLLRVGETIYLSTTILPENATNKNITWSSSNANVATVDNGNVNAIAMGEAEITATTQDGGFKAVYKITVGIPVDWIEVTNVPYQIATGDKYTLSVNIHPENATNKSLVWTSSDTNIATVNNGTITAIANGGAYITATAADNCGANLSTFISVITVATGISLDKTTAEIFIGESIKLTPKITPDNTSDKYVHWETSNYDVATVDNGIVKGCNPGKSIITVYTNDWQLSASCTVTVKPIPVTGISLSKTSVEMSQGDQITLVPTITPSNATNKNIIWSSSSDKAKVVNGVVTAIRAGEVTITAKTEDGGHTATCKLYIKAKNGVDPGEWEEGENNEGEAQ